MFDSSEKIPSRLPERFHRLETNDNIAQKKLKYLFKFKKK